MRRTRYIAAAAVASLALTGCSIQIQSAPDPSIPDDTMLIAALYVFEPLLILDNVTGVRGVP